MWSDKLVVLNWIPLLGPIWNSHVPPKDSRESQALPEKGLCWKHHFRASELLPTLRMTQFWSSLQLLCWSWQPTSVAGGTRAHGSRPLSVGSWVVEYPKSNDEQAAGDVHVSSGWVWEKVPSWWGSIGSRFRPHRQGASPADQRPQPWMVARKGVIKKNILIFCILFCEGALSCCLASNIQPVQDFGKTFNSF